jgi:hypothetical protein
MGTAWARRGGPDRWLRGILRAAPPTRPHYPVAMSIKSADYPFWLRVLIVITLALFAVNVFFFLGPLVWFATTVKITATDVGSWLGALFATFIGAFLAFLFGIRQRERQRVDQEVTAGNLALSTLSEMWERQFQFQREVVAPFRNRSDAWLNLTIGTRLDSVDLKLNRNDLGFVLQADGPTWQAVILEDLRYQLMKQRIEFRDNLVLKEVWPCLVAHRVPIGANMPEAEVEAMLGPAIVQQLRVHTASIISLIDENVESSWAAMTALRETLRRIHPGRRFVVERS